MIRRRRPPISSPSSVSAADVDVNMSYTPLRSHSETSLLDQLLVVCPNSDFCEEVLTKSALKTHLEQNCPGSNVKCPNYAMGCAFQGPRLFLPRHLNDCHPGRDYENMKSFVNPCPKHVLVSSENGVTKMEVNRGENDLGFSFVGGYDTPLKCIVVQEVYRDGLIGKNGLMKPGDQLLEVDDVDLAGATHLEVRELLAKAKPTCKLVVYREAKEPTHTTFRRQGTQDRAVDRQMKCKYSRCLRQPMRQAVNGIGKDFQPFRIEFMKSDDRPLGIKIAGKKNRQGVYVFGLVPGGVAQTDGRLHRDDRILEINGIDLRRGSQLQASDIIKASPKHVSILVSRSVPSPPPDIVLTTSRRKGTSEPSLTPAATPNPSPAPSQPVGEEEEAASPSQLPDYVCISPLNSPTSIEEKEARIVKAPADSFGLSIAGGRGSQRGDIPLYVTNLRHDGPAHQCGAIAKGDVVLAVGEHSLIGLTHQEAVKSLKETGYEASEVTVRILSRPLESFAPGEDSSQAETDFVPSWKYWLCLPANCHLPQTVSLERDAHGSLGFSVIGGYEDARSAVQPIVVKSIVSHGPAHLSGKLRCGDILLAVDGESVSGVDHEHAVSLLRRKSHSVNITILSWPGTVV